MNIAIEGCAAAGSFGFGRNALQRAINDPPIADTSGGFPVLPKADVSIISSFVQARALRQIDHFTRMALIGAFAALGDAGLSPEDARDMGLIMASGYGPAQTTFSFLDSIEEYGPNMASPLSFSFSVQNIPAANVALKLGLAGPCTTVCQFESSVASALLTAASWLAEGRVSRVLFGAVDETTPILADITARITAENSRCGENERRSLPLGEGAAFFCLSKDTGGAKAVIEDVWLRAVSSFSVSGKERADHIYYSGSLRGLPETAKRESIRRGLAYGNIPVALAFDMFAAVSALERGEAARISCVSSSPAGAVSGAVLSLPASPER